MKSFKQIREKTLTPAEKKKREEIAKAMERENPGMPMAKKMAIATATAKKVAEEVEELEEYIRKNKFSKMTSTSKSNTKGVERFAIINDNDDIEVYNSKTKRLIRKVRMSNHQSAIQRLKKATYKSSLDTFKGYQMWYMSTEGGVRFSDVDRALEEAQGIDEISDKMKDRYIQKSMGDHQHANAVRKDAESRGDKGLASKMKDRMKKRNQGMTRAFGNAKESVEHVDEASTMYVIKHKKTKQVLSTHSDYNTAKDEHEGLGKDKHAYGVYKQTKKDAALRNRNTYREEVEQVDEKSKGLWANIHAKRKRGEKPNPPGHPDRPTKADFERSQK